MVDENKDFKFDEPQSPSDDALSNDTPAVAGLKGKNTAILIVVVIVVVFLFLKMMTGEDKEKIAAQQAQEGKTFTQEVKPEGKVAVAVNEGRLKIDNTASTAGPLTLPPPAPPPPAFEPPSLYLPTQSQQLPALPTVAGAGGTQTSPGGLPTLGMAGSPAAKSDLFSEQNRTRLTSSMFVGGGSGGGIGGIGGGTVADPNTIGTTSAESVVVTTVGSTTDSIIQGKVIDAVLETAINTDLPGSLRAIVSRDVYAESGRRILIPKGSRLIGSYKSDVKVGQVRIYVVWTRVIRPDGVDAMLESQTIDLLGRSGLVGVVDNKFFEIFSSSFLLSALTISFAIAADSVVPENNVTQGETGSGDATTSGSVAAISTKQAIEDFGGTVKDVMSKLIDVNPRITVDQGTRIKIFVNRDIKFPPEYFSSIKFIN
jgi:type IV secretion system protein VirB10